MNPRGRCSPDLKYTLQGDRSKEERAALMQNRHTIHSPWGHVRNTFRF